MTKLWAKTALKMKNIPFITRQFFGISGCRIFNCNSGDHYIIYRLENRPMIKYWLTHDPLNHRYKRSIIDNHIWYKIKVVQSSMIIVDQYSLFNIDPQTGDHIWVKYDIRSSVDFRGYRWSYNYYSYMIIDYFLKWNSTVDKLILRLLRVRHPLCNGRGFLKTFGDKTDIVPNIKDNETWCCRYT